MQEHPFKRLIALAFSGQSAAATRSSLSTPCPRDPRAELGNDTDDDMLALRQSFSLGNHPLALE